MNNDQFATKFGPWAVVTGASSGIGTQYATQLASRGLNVVLVARNADRLKEIAMDLEKAYGIETRVAAADLGQENFLDAIAPHTDGLDVGLLVSNAGSTSMGAFLRIPAHDLTTELRLNTTAHLELAHYFGERLVARGSGGIVLVGSTIGLQGTPFLANYSAAKAYIHALGQALNWELRNSGVHASVIAPGTTATPGALDRTDIEVSKMPGPIMAVDKLVNISLKGLENNTPIVIAGASNRIPAAIMRRVMPRNAATKVFGSMIAKHAPAELSM